MSTSTVSGTPIHPLADGESVEWLVWRIMKPGSRLVGRTCQSKVPVDNGDGKPMQCRRPVWGDGRVNGDFHGLCSRCWHQWNAFHGSYTTMKANPAAASLGAVSIARLTFREAELSELKLQSDKMPDTYDPEDWQ